MSKAPRRGAPGLCRHLRARGLNVIEVNQPDRHRRRRRGKSDRIDAEMAARAVLAGDATALPKAGDGPVEALRQLRLARTGAIKARTAAANQLHSVCDTAPDLVRAQLRGLTTRRKVAVASRLPAWRSVDPNRWRETCAGERRSTLELARRRDPRTRPGHQSDPRHDRRTAARTSRCRLRNRRRAALHGG